MKTLVKWVLEWVLGLLVEVSKELDEWELFRLKGFNGISHPEFRKSHGEVKRVDPYKRNLRQVKRLLSNKDVVGFYITPKERNFVIGLSSEGTRYTVTDKGISLESWEGHKLKTRINILGLGLDNLYLIKGYKDMSDWSIRQKFSQTLHENLKYFHEDFYDRDSTESTPEPKAAGSAESKATDLDSWTRMIERMERKSKDIESEIESKNSRIKKDVQQLNEKAEALRNLL